jgi:hypothetical protein
MRGSLAKTSGSLAQRCWVPVLRHTCANAGPGPLGARIVGNGDFPGVGSVGRAVEAPLSGPLPRPMKRPAPGLWPGRADGMLKKWPDRMGERGQTTRGQHTRTATVLRETEAGLTEVGNAAVSRRVSSARCRWVSDPLLTVAGSPTASARAATRTFRRRSRARSAPGVARDERGHERRDAGAEAGDHRSGQRRAAHGGRTLPGSG